MERKHSNPRPATPRLKEIPEPIVIPVTESLNELKITKESSNPKPAGGNIRRKPLKRLSLNSENEIMQTIGIWML